MEVHVLDPDQKGYFEGTATEVKGDKVAVIFDDSESAEWIDLKHVYLVPAAAERPPEEFVPEPDTDVEVYSEEEKAWWQGRVKSSKNGCYLVVFPNQEFNDLYEPQALYPVMTRQRFNLESKKFPVDPSLKKFVLDMAEDLHAVAEVADLCSLWPDGDECRFLVGMGTRAALENAQRAVDMHMHRIAELGMLHQKKEKIQKFIEQRADFRGAVTMEFQIDPSLIGLAVGKGGANIKKASSIPGVNNIDISSSGLVKINADTEAAALEAESLVHFISCTFAMDPGELGYIKGNNGDNLQYVKNNSGVTRLLVRGSPPEIEFIGTQKSVEAARQLIYLQHHYFAKKKEIQSEIRSLEKDLDKRGVRLPPGLASGPRFSGKPRDRGYGMGRGGGRGGAAGGRPGGGGQRRDGGARAD